MVVALAMVVNCFRRRAGKIPTVFRGKIMFLRFLGFNALYTIKKKAYTRRLTNALLCLTLRNNSNSN